MSQIAEREMEKNKAEQAGDAEQGDSNLQRDLEAHLLRRAPGSTTLDHLICFFATIFTFLTDDLRLLFALLQSIRLRKHHRSPSCS